MHQIATDIPFYKVTNQHGKSQVLHQNWLLLVTSEVGIPLCMGNCHTWDRCTSPTPHKTTSVRVEMKWTPQENNGKAVTQWPTSKASLGWINGKLWPLPWMSTGTSTKDGWKPQVMWCGCRPQKEHVHKAEGTTLVPIDAGRQWTPWQMQPLMELGHGRQGPCKEEQDTPPVYLSDTEYSHPPEDGPLPPVEGWLHTLHGWWWKRKSNTKRPESTARAWGCPPQRKGGIAR